MPQITPVIATQQEAYDYLGLSAAAVALNVQSGTLLATWITSLLNQSAEAIVAEIDYDYTPLQVHTVREFGNGLRYTDLEFPVQAISTVTSWDSLNPATAPVDESANHLILAPFPYRIYRADGTTFARTSEYKIVATQANDPRFGAGWPLDCKRAQFQLMQIYMQESNNGPSSLAYRDYESSTGRPIQYEDKDKLEKSWKRLVRKYKRIPA